LDFIAKKKCEKTPKKKCEKIAKKKWGVGKGSEPTPPKGPKTQWGNSTNSTATNRPTFSFWRTRRFDARRKLF
jgi:hypothetical protein